MKPRLRSGLLATLCGVQMFSLATAEDVTESPASSPAFVLTDGYDSEMVEGWKVLVNRAFRQQEPELYEQTLALLRHQLYGISRKLKGEPLEELRSVTIWVEEREPHHPCMCYHPDAGWLVEHGMNPDKARCVELANARNFLTWTLDQPWMVFHELAHAYHHQILPDGYENSDVRTAYDDAMTNKRYESVLRVNGKREPAYAATNPMEYFAELSEAYFGTNDFYPYVASELLEHDPAMHALLGKLWQEK